MINQRMPRDLRQRRCSVYILGTLGILTDTEQKTAYAYAELAQRARPLPDRVAQIQYRPHIDTWYSGLSSRASPYDLRWQTIHLHVRQQGLAAFFDRLILQNQLTHVKTLQHNKALRQHFKRTLQTIDQMWGQEPEYVAS